MVLNMLAYFGVQFVVVGRGWWAGISTAESHIRCSLPMLSAICLLQRRHRTSLCHQTRRTHSFRLPGALARAVLTSHQFIPDSIPPRISPFVTVSYFLLTCSLIFIYTVNPAFFHIFTFSFTLTLCFRQILAIVVAARKGRAHGTSHRPPSGGSSAQGRISL